MAKIRVESKCEIYDGISITFKAPCNNTAVDGLNVYHKGVSRSFTFRDAHGKNLAGVNNLFSAGTYVKAVLDTANNYAYLQNTDTNAYLEEILAEKLDANMGVENAGLYLKVGADGSLIYANPVAKFSQGPVLITETQTLDMSKYGLRVGDQINVICIGGGGAGGSGNYSTGGAGGKAGSSASYQPPGYNYQGHGGGGGGGGYGGGGGGGTGHSLMYAGSGGGGGGFLSAKTVTLTSTSVAVTIGAAGQPQSGSTGGSGGTTSFGSYLSASGGNGGSSGTYSRAGSGGSGGHNGGSGSYYKYSDGSSNGGVGGGGGGGWIIENFTIYSGTDGESVNSSTGAGGKGGTNGGAVGQDSTTGFGHGCVVFWY